MDDFDTDVLIVGSGPTGSTAALALATYGIKTHVVTRYNWLADSPRAHITNQRAMEVLRDLGIENEVELYATSWDQMGDTVFATSLAGDEVARLRAWGTGEARLADYLAASPCPPRDIIQPSLESILVKNAAARGASFAFNTSYTSHRQDADGVTVSLLERLTGRRFSMRARYLVGADGANSAIVDELDLPIEGEMARAATAYVLFHADLSEYVEHRPSVLYWIMTSAADFGEIGMGLLRAVQPWHTWIAGWGFDPENGEPDLGEETVLRRIRALVGDPELEVSIEKVSTWHINQAWATEYSSGRVFCGGDAVHRHPPSNGLGSNTSIQDAFNLAWKLAYVVDGHADVSLLDSYTAERAPVGQEIVARANKSRIDYAPLNECVRRSGEGDPLAAGLARLDDPGVEGVTARAALGEALALKQFEFNAHGVELNQRYASSAVVSEPDGEVEQWHRDRELYSQATTRPGAKIPHVWLVDERGRRTSTLDVTGKGRFSLVTGIGGTSWVTAVESLRLPFLRVVVVGDRSSRDPYFLWHNAREVEEAGALLIRPDGYVAWRHAEAVVDDEVASELLLDALTRVLGKKF